MTSDNSSPSAPETSSRQETVPTDAGEKRFRDTVQHELLSAGVRPDRAPIVAERLLTVVTHHHSGPLPSVQDFGGYEDVCVGASRDILDMAKRQQQHEHWIGKASLALEFAGLATAIIIIGLMLWTAYLLALQSHTWLAGLVLTGSVSGLVGIFWQKKDGNSGSPQQPKSEAGRLRPAGRKRKK